MLEELQQTYNDVCNTTVKNLDLEEKSQFEDALKGWKSLHTLLLYKIDVFEKKPRQIHAEESAILSELKSIRDENVKHLVRLQLRLDEQKRKLKKQAEALPLQNSSLPLQPSGSAHNLSIPSLRNTNPTSRSFSNNQRQMMKSLRNGSQTTVKMSAQNRDAVKQAASILWQKPKAKPKVPDLFDDFDQTEISTNNWERLNSGGLASTDLSTLSNLIDLNDDDEVIYAPPVSRSLESLTLDPGPILKKKPPPPPPPKRGAAPKPQTLLLSSPTEPVNLAKPAIKQALKLTPDVRTQPKSYSYTQPQPINVKKMMAASSSRSKVSVKPKTVAKPAVKPSAPALKPQTSQTSLPALTKQVKKLNITYNYKIVEKPKTQVKPKVKPVAAVKQEPETPNSPTMDDILGGYEEHHSVDMTVANGGGNGDANGEANGDMDPAAQEALIKLIRGIDELAATQILNDIIVRGDEVYWDDIVGLDSAKNSLKEAVVYPFLRPDLFRGLREPTRGMLLFGPPGTGKTMLARAVATESKSTFFSISSSSLTSKYLGESEKLVKALFLLARKLSPSIVFIDEIDSLLGSRTEGEIDSMRRIKNEFLVQWSELSSAAAGRDSSAGDVSRVLILGATNLPWAIDDAARRRFAKRVYIPLPEDETRRLQIKKLLAYQKNTLLEEDYDKLMELTKGFSGSDITLLAKDSAMGPLRSLGDKLLSTPTEEIRSIQLEDFVDSLKYIRPSVSTEGLFEYENWSAKFGSSGA